MIKRGKYFVPPPKDCRDFKELFNFAVSVGAGRPVDDEGLAVGPWTAELLAAAISNIETNRAGVELRTVQHWFQENDKGIGAENIRWLARIFGCSDPDASGEWQVALSAANRRLRENRKRTKAESSSEAGAVPDSLTGSNPEAAPVQTALDTRPLVAKRRFRLAETTEALFCRSPLNLPSAVFAGAVGLGFMSYFLGIHEVTFDAVGGVRKQIGFLWAPNWTFLFMAFMPLFFLFVAELLVYWRNEGRFSLQMDGDRIASNNAWTRNVEASSLTFLAVFLICLLFAGVFQWVGVRLLPLLQGGGNYATDWGSLAIVRPEIISVPKAIVFTGLAYLYMSICFYLFFAALILLYSVAQDFGKVLAAVKSRQDSVLPPRADLIGARIMLGIFRCTVLAIFVAMCMKLQSTYLASTGMNVANWLIGDIASTFNRSHALDRFADFTAPNHFSSLIIVLAAVFVFVYGASRAGIECRFLVRLWMMFVTVGLLVASYLLIGAFAGFSALLAVAVLLAIYGLFDPGFGLRKLHELEG